MTDSLRSIGSVKVKMGCHRGTGRCDFPSRSCLSHLARRARFQKRGYLGEQKDAGIPDRVAKFTGHWNELWSSGVAVSILQSVALRCSIKRFGVCRRKLFVPHPPLSFARVRIVRVIVGKSRFFFSSEIFFLIRAIRGQGPLNSNIC